MNLKNYLFSWIANLGVVPLLLLAAFLLFPIFLSLFALLVFEIRVFETIASLLAGHMFQHFNILRKIKYLPIGSRTVKTSLLLFIFAQTPLHAAKNSRSIIMAKGEHFELKTPTIEKLVIGNPETISYKITNKNNTLLLKGKKLGFTELVIWPKKGKKRSFQIYVLSKTKHLNRLRVAKELKELGLLVENTGSLIRASGEIKNLRNYLLLIKLKRKYPKEVHFELNLSKTLRNKIISQIYNYFYKRNIEDISCQIITHEIDCHYTENEIIDKRDLNELSKKFDVKISPLKKYLKKNFIVRIKIIQIEKLNGDEFHLGLDKLENSLKNIFNEGLISLINNNKVFLQKHHLSLSTLAEPQFIIKNNKMATLEIGSEIPFPTQSNEGPQTEWKFAGLKINLKVNKKRIGYDTNFEVELTQSTSSGQISGTKEKSSVFINEDLTTTLFKIGYQAFGKQEKKIPILSSIPLIGRLFTSSSTRNNYKQILAFITIKET